MENAASNGMCSDNQDPDYQLFNSRESHQNIFEKNARSTAAKKISKIIEAEFMKEIKNKKDEIHKIFKELSKSCKMLNYLRYAIVTDFYNQENTLIDPQTSKQSRPHPTVNAPTKSVPVVDINFANNCLQELEQENKRKRKIKTEAEECKKKCLQSVDRKIEASKSNTTATAPITYANYKTKQRIIVGNISKWIPPDLRGNNASHKWTVYIRDSEKSDLGQIISKVRFFLHPSYKPNDVVELISPPFHLARLGWGEFPIRVQLHFSNGIDKPVDIIHHLKLDRTFTGLQTIGSETVADIWISMKDTSVISIQKEAKKQDIVLNNIKEEKSSDKQEEPKTTPKNKTSYQSEKFYTDHDYIVTNVKYDPEPSCHSQKVQVLQNHIVHNPQNSIIGTETCSSNDFKKINLGQNLKENPRTLLKINHKKVLLNNKTVYISTHSGLAKAESNENSSINDKHMLDYLNNESGLSKMSDIDEKRMYLKISNHITSEENARSLENLINHAKPSSLDNMLKFVCRRMPLITEKSTDPHYKILYPYASESYEVFSNCSSAKQRSLERYRAMSALEIMNNTKCYNYPCTVKEFITWARRYCYTPYLDFKNIHKMCTSTQTVKLKDNEEKYRYSSTVSDEIKNWLTECQNVSPSIKNHDKKDDDQIDIVNISSSTSNTLSMKQNSNVKNNPLTFVDYPENKNSLNEFVCRTAQKIGIKLTNEEIVPGVLHSSASVLITKAVECLIDELARVAFACSLDKCKTEDAISIESDDVRMALLKKEEFEIFTNAGLGSDG
ncbi:hypothetical protein TSAR_012047 [Trichomalopsis sarcophagae]|uniref:YEATS domain-containing protein n=1 Tax=Trichomalopsis sarcophagae TaxID=543379 RepID=A0A232F540_9HYME|nr:hypothetical protein TSAR_012047 [Trichomalopsis sarcophagae]